MTGNLHSVISHEWSREMLEQKKKALFSHWMLSLKINKPKQTQQTQTDKPSQPTEKKIPLDRSIFMKEDYIQCLI